MKVYLAIKYHRGIPIITVARKGSDISTTLQGISQQFFPYDNFDELLHFFQTLPQG
jgi:hypothetical protein